MNCGVPGSALQCTGLTPITTQRYNWVVIPEFDEKGNLPEGVHDATVEEVRARFAYNPTRQKLFDAFLEVLEILQSCKSPEVHLDGSFITTKEEPSDYDMCWESTGVEPTDELREFLELREQRKERYLGDIFLRIPQPPYFYDHVEHWQSDSRQDDVVKGIIRINLGGEVNDQE